MNLGTWLATNIITEQSKIKTIVAIYPGRFQPMGKHHAQTFKWLQNKFGKNNSYVVTSDKTAAGKSPFNFIEKKSIINKHGIKNVVQVKNPYVALEALKDYDPATTAAVFMVGKKDAQRLGGKFFKPWHGTADVGYRDGAYTIIAPHVSLKIPKFGEMSGTTIRQALASGNPNLFKQIMGWYDPKIYNLIKKKLSIKEIIGPFLNSFNFKKLITEISDTGLSGEGMVDDGPPTYFVSYNGYKSKGDFFAQQLGWKVLDYIIDKSDVKPVTGARTIEPVTYFPAGVQGKQTPINTVDIKGVPAYKKWQKRIKQVASQVGYKLLDFLDADDSIESSDDEPNKAKSTVSSIVSEGFWKEIFEDISVPVNIGDTVLMGRFKNKKVVVKSITKNEKGDYLINGRPAFKFRLLPKQEPANEVYVSKSLQQALNRTPMKTRYQIVDPDGESLAMLSPYDLKTSSTLRNLLKYFTSEKRSGVNADAPDEYFVVDLKTNKIVDGWKWIKSGNGYKNIKIPKNLTEGLITEGGAAGHMAHPFDERDLTFGDLKQLIRLSLEGELDIEESVTEKSDGQNLQVTWKDGKLGAARNKTTVKQPLDIDDIRMKFAGRGDIENAFVYAMEDLETAIAKLPDNVRDEIFQNGRRFMNMEIIYPATKNVITYGPVAYIQFHGLDEFDENANKVGSLPEYGTKLQKIIAKVNADTQKHFKIIPPKILTLNQVPDFEKKEAYFIKEVDKLQRQFKLKDSDEVSRWHQRWWEAFINKNFPNAAPDVKQGLLRRWAYHDKSFRLNKKTIPDIEVLSKAIEHDKGNFKIQEKSNIYNFEKIFLELGAEVLQNISNYISVVPDQAIQDIRRSIAKTMKDVQASNDLTVLSKMERELKRINNLGGFEKIVPIEGIVFVYKGKTYKLTGLFAPINQLLGLTKFI